MIDYASSTPQSRDDRQAAHASPALWGVGVMGWTALGVIAFGVVAAVLTFGSPLAMERGPLPGPWGFVRRRDPSISLVLLFSMPAFLSVMVLVALATAVRVRRRRHAAALLGYLHQAVRLNLPLPAMLRAAQQSERGRLRRRIGRLCDRLEDGYGIGRSLELAEPGVTRRTAALVQAAERAGRLPAALDRLTRREHAAARPPTARAVYLRWYPAVTLAFLGGAVWVFLILVMPKLHELYASFNLSLPPLTVAAMRFWGTFGTMLTALALLALAVSCGQMVAHTVAPRWAGATPLRRPLDRLAWGLPVFGRLARDRAMGDAFHVAADALAAGFTLDRALRDAAGVPTNAVLQDRLARWGEALAEGRPVGEAARAARMPELVCGLLGGATPLTAGTPEVFRFLARYYDARHSRTAALLEGAAVPALSLGFGVLVGAFVTGMMLPLIELTNALTESGGVL